MTRVTSDLNDAGVFSLIPNGVYNGHVVAVLDHDKNDVGKPLVSKAGAPMCQLDWMIDEGEYSERKIRFDTIMLGGTSAEGKPISLGKLCSFLHFTGTPWECMHCSNGESGRKFYIAEGDQDDKAAGLKKGNFYCPDCKNPTPRISYDTTNFMGARSGIGVNSEKAAGSDRMYNKITGYTDLR